MAGKEPSPTFLIGVGQAGIEVLETLKRHVPEEESAYFDYLIVDSNMSELNSSSIEKNLYLKTPDTLVGTHREEFPFLTNSMRFGAKGAERQRPVGRYKFDNPEEPSFSDVFKTIQRNVNRFRQDHQTALTSSNKHINILLVNSLGGGTGSGTFPILTGILHHLAENIRNRNNMFAYLGGFGVVPEFEFGRDIKQLPGDDGRYYANSYAALRDLEHLLNADANDSLRLPIHSRHDPDGDTSTSDAIDAALEENAFEFDTQPFNDYFLVGVNEDKIEGEQSSAGLERYDQMIDNTVAESIYTMAKHGDDMENVSGVSDTDPRVGTVVETEVEIPHETLRTYCETKSEIEALESLLYAGRSSLEATDSDLDAIEHLVRNSDVVFEQLDPEEASETKREVREIIDNSLGGGVNMVNRTREDIASVLDQVEAEHDLRFVPFALDEIESALDEQEPKVREKREETVSEMWKHFELSSHPEFGDVSRVNQKARNLFDFLRGRIEDTKVELEEVEESFWDGKPGIKGREEKLNSRLSNLKEALERLREVEDDYDGLNDLSDGIVDQRAEIESRLKHKKRELGDARDDLKSLRRELTDPDQSGLRIARMPLEPEALEEVTLEKLETDLTDIESYLDEGYVDRDDFLEAIARRYERCFQKEPRLVLDVDEDDAPDDALNYFQSLGMIETDMYIVYDDDNEDAISFERVSTASSGYNRYTDDSYDSHRVKFVAYVRTGPVDVLRLYQELDSYADDGGLDDLVAQHWDDYRLAFAYPEWYGRDVRSVFGTDKTIQLPMPPEPKLEYVQLETGAADEGELKHEFISRDGVVSYLYQGVLWDNYEDGAIGFRGWKQALDGVQLGWNAVQELSPASEKKRQWLAGNVSWEELLEEYAREFEDREGIKIEFVDEEATAD